MATPMFNENTKDTKTQPVSVTQRDNLSVPIPEFLVSRSVGRSDELNHIAH
jgi:hypothetical protein